jgi:N-methylhydantoinase B/oxoprolinase/acetone carboxylase alpha subunit
VNERPINPKSTHYPLKAGDVVHMWTAGGGGWGDPARREPAAIERDLADDKITPAYAGREHSGGASDGAPSRLREENP